MKQFTIRGFLVLLALCFVGLTGCASSGPYAGHPSGYQMPQGQQATTYVPQANAETQQAWNRVMGSTGAEPHMVSGLNGYQTPGVLSYADQQQIKTSITQSSQYLTSGPQYEAVEQGLWQQYHASNSQMDRMRYEYAIQQLHAQKDLLKTGIAETNRTKRTMISESHRTERTLIDANARVAGQQQETNRVVVDNVGWVLRDIIHGIVRIELK